MKRARIFKLMGMCSAIAAVSVTFAACGSTGGDTGAEAEGTTAALTETATTTTTETTTPTTTTQAAETETTTTAVTETTVAKEEPVTTAKSAGDELGGFRDYLQDLYNSYPKTDGVLTEESGGSSIKYQKFAIADFDGDGEDELAIEEHVKTDSGYDTYNLALLEKDGLYGDPWEHVAIENKAFSDVTFRNNGVASAFNDGLNTSFPLLDNTEYHILNRNMLSKLNYNMNSSDANYDWSSALYVLHYYTEGGQIKKLLGSGQEAYFEPKVKTESEYEQEKQLLNSGKDIQLDIKDFTAENIGL